MLDDDLNEPHGWCDNSRRWVWKLDVDGLPNTCPEKGYFGNSYCKGEGCGYYRERLLTPHAKRKIKILRGIEV